MTGSEILADRAKARADGARLAAELLRRIAEGLPAGDKRTTAFVLADAIEEYATELATCHSEAVE